MAKNIKAVIKLYCPGGQANPAPPVGPALGQHGVGIMDFCKAYNDQTKDRQGITLPVVINVYEDRTFTFIVKSPPSSFLLKRACNLAKASGAPNKEKVGTLTRQQVEEIAKEKMRDLNTDDIDAAVNITSTGNHYYRVCSKDETGNTGCSNVKIVSEGQLK